MALEFKIKDFLHPIAILKLRAFLEKSQWFSREQLKEYQEQRLECIIAHAYENVPYYRDLFNNLKLKPEDIKYLEDLKKITPLTKEILRKNFKSLTAQNAGKFSPILHQTSGTSGEPVKFYSDRSSNILEFCYYWRYWSWAGYRLGRPFAEFTLHHFLNSGINSIYEHSFLTKRLMLNPSQLSYENISEFVSAIKKYRPAFLKGSPSSIFIFASLLEKKGYNNLSFKAIFTTGELLFPYQRKKIENAFRCKILDSYGHMERTVAICQCPMGRYHTNSDYGILEVEEGKAIGTSLYNMAMPLIRYEIGDIIKIPIDVTKCECGKGLPTCEGITGRAQDIIITPDGRLLSNVFILFDILEGVLWAQIVQDGVSKLRIRIIRGDKFSVLSVENFIRKLRNITCPGMTITEEYLPTEKLHDIIAKKYRPIVSHVAVNI